ncbi:sigma-70 family RNA polymerase sigma factor [Cellulomonas fimi]|uniref:RNA polymerase sigma factor n=1 Tax=Cellulomonas fimi TaxID=1708 RepID=UPI00234D2F12|nr:sigma-70 family RNA polymerase sigma factor [Cellulomonas fimi]MDC7122883.1 sigma-70 family RNA polymerase sigma factor [Cellulomonas fimi]
MSRWEPMLDALVRERYPALLTRATLLVRDRHTAEDLVQDALVATFGGRARFASLPEAEQYVRRAIVSRFYDRYRRVVREGSALRRVAHERSDDTVPAPGTSHAGLSDALEDALALLPPRERACVVLRHVEDLPVRETADVLRLSEGAVKRYTADGLRTLAVHLRVDPPPATGTATVPVVLTTTEVHGD